MLPSKHRRIFSMKTIFENAGLQYGRQGDYSLPQLKVGNANEHYIGVWGQRYRRYLKEHHRIIYYNYLTAGTLYRHLAEADERANEMFERLVKELSAKEGVTAKLKASNPMEWVRQTNNIRSRASEIVCDELFRL